MAYRLTELVTALHDKRVRKALEIALRDQRIRARFRRLREEMTVAEACEMLSKEFFLSPERVRSIVYRRRVA